MTQSCKFRDPNIKNPKFETYVTQLYKFNDRHYILLKLVFGLPNIMQCLVCWSCAEGRKRGAGKGGTREFNGRRKTTTSQSARVWVGRYLGHYVCESESGRERAEACQAVDEEREGLWLPARLGFKCFSFLFESNLKFKFE
jgi:hypothetical protein